MFLFKTVGHVIDPDIWRSNVSYVLFPWLRGGVSGKRKLTVGGEARVRILAIEFVCFFSFFLSFLFLFIFTFSIFPLLLKFFLLY